MKTVGKKYIDEDGALVFVSYGISSGARWMTVRQKTPKSGTHRIKARGLPVRLNRADAQEDLDEYAKAKGWKEA